MPGKAFVAGVGMVPFGKPGASVPYDVMAEAAVRKALDNARLSYDAVQQAIVGYVYGDSTSGQRALYEVGMTGIPIANVNNNCSTGSTALFLARQLVESGAVDCVLALGFEQMQPGALSGQWTDRPSPFSRFDELCDEIAPYDDVNPSAENIARVVADALAAKIDDARVSVNRVELWENDTCAATYFRS